MVVQNSNQINIYVELYHDFLANHGESHLDRKIAKAYKIAVGRQRTRRICSSIQRGFIFAWESQSWDAQEDFKFALTLDFSALRQKYEIVA